MVNMKPIKVDKEVKKTLDDLKKYPRETYNDTLRKVLKLNHVKNGNKEKGKKENKSTK